MRGAANAAKGIDTDATGKVAGADARAKDFLAQPASDEKTALLAEIDRRYHAASGSAPGTKIQPNESGKSDLWRSIRDEVLFQHHYIANLPDNVKALIHVSIKGRDLTPADYDQLFRIAKKIEALPPGAAADYTSKITGNTTDLATFEAAIDGYRGELARREQADAERSKTRSAGRRLPAAAFRSPVATIGSPRSCDACMQDSCRPRHPYHSFCMTERRHS